MIFNYMVIIYENMKRLTLFFIVACFMLMLNSCITLDDFRGPYEYSVRYGEVIVLPHGMRVSGVCNYRRQLRYNIVPMEKNYVPKEKTYWSRDGKRTVIKEQR